MIDFFSNHAVLFALVCAAVAIAYGIGLTVWLLRQPAGDERMQEIGRAIQEGAAAYLRRQYQTIAVVAIVPFLLLGFYNELGWGTAIGFLDRRGPLCCGRVHRHERCRALEHAHRGGCQERAQACPERGLPRRLGHGPARRRPRPARGRRLLLGSHRLARSHVELGDQRPRRPRLRRLAHLRLRAARRRHLHQGRRRGRGPRREDRGRDPGGRSAQPRRDRGQRRRQRGRLCRDGGRPVRDLRRHRGRRDAARFPDLPGPPPGALPARDRRHLDPLVGDRHLLRARRAGTARS